MIIFESRFMALMGIILLALATGMLIVADITIAREYNIPVWLIPLIIATGIIIWLLFKIKKANDIIFHDPTDPTKLL